MRVERRPEGPLMVSDLLAGVPGLVAGVSTRPLGDVSREGTGPAAGRLVAALGWEGPAPAFLLQVHGARVLDAPPPAGAEGDGLVARRPGLLVGVRVADCLPVIVAPRTGGVVAVLHAGWRGLAAGILEEGIARVARIASAAPADLVAALGPAIGPCCFEVGPEVVEAVGPAPGQVRPGEGDRAFLDLRGAAADRLRALGLREVDTEAPCTRCEAGLLHSFRRDADRSGRLAAVAGYVSSAGAGGGGAGASSSV